MSKKYSSPVDDNAYRTVERYENYMSGKTSSGYFDVEEFELIVEYYLRKGRTKEGYEAVALGLKTHPNSSTLRVKRAKVYLATGDSLKAYRILENLSTHDYETSLLKVDALLRLERDAEADELCRSVLTLEEINNHDYACLDIAFIYLNKLKFEKSVEYLLEGLKTNADNVDILFELAYCYEQINDYDKALAVHKRIIGIDPYTSEAWFNMGQIYFSSQDYAKALDAYDYVLAIDPEDSFVYMQKGHIMAQLEQFDKAIENYKEYAKLTSDSWQIHIFIAECYEKQEKYDEAIFHYKTVVDSAPDNYEGLSGLAICLLETEQYEQSLEYLRKAVEIKPESHEVWVYTGEAFIGMDNPEKALACYLHAIELEPHQPDTYLTIGNLFLEKMDFEKALDYYMTAFEMDTTLEHINLFLAVANFKTGHLELALRFLQEAIDSDDNAVSLFMELCPEASLLAEE